MDEECRSQDAEGDSHVGYYLVSAGPADEESGQRHEEGRCQGKRIQDIARGGDAETMDDLEVRPIVGVPATKMAGLLVRYINIFVGRSGLQSDLQD